MLEYIIIVHSIEEEKNLKLVTNAERKPEIKSEKCKLVASYVTKIN